MESYLENRYNRVSMNNSKPNKLSSKWVHVKHGVPQSMESKLLITQTASKFLVYYKNDRLLNCFTTATYILSHASRKLTTFLHKYPTSAN